MKVSVIIPIYGVEKYIEKCARSVFEQTYSNLEIIFVDDCTPDNSISILKRVLEEYPQMKDKTQILSYPKNKGVAGARQTGLDAAHGEYTIQFDPDDYVETDMIEKMVAKAVDDNADIVLCDFKLIQGEKETYLHINPSLNPIECMKQVLSGEVHGSLANKLIRRSLYVENSIAFTQGLNMREDLSVMYRLLYFAKKLAYVPQPFYNYVLREGSYTNSRVSIMSLKNTEELLLQMDTFCAQEKIADLGLLSVFSQFVAINVAYVIVRVNHKMMQSIKYIPITFSNYLSKSTLSLKFRILGIMGLMHLTPILKIISIIYQKKA